MGGRDHKGVGDWLLARPLWWRQGVQVVATDSPAAFRKALRTWLPRTAVSVDLFHMSMLANDMLNTVRQGLSQQVRAGGAGPRTRRRRTGWLLLKAEENLSKRGRHRLAGVLCADDPTGSLLAAWQVKEQLRTLLNASSLEDAGAAKNALDDRLRSSLSPARQRRKWKPTTLQ